MACEPLIIQREIKCLLVSCISVWIGNPSEEVSFKELLSCPRRGFPKPDMAQAVEENWEKLDKLRLSLYSAIATPKSIFSQ